MSDAANPLDSLQLTDYGSAPIGLQDYSSLDNLGLAAPTLDTPLGVDPFNGTSMYDSTAPALTQIAPDASNGLNAYNDGLLPLSNPNSIDSAIIAKAQGGSQAFSSGADLTILDNLPLTAANTSIDTLLGSPTVKPVAVSQPMGASLWAFLFGTTASILGGAKSGVAGAPTGKNLPGAVKTAPKTATTNPISKTTTIFIVLGVLLVGAVAVEHFAGAK